MQEQAIQITCREELAEVLTEAVEIEHNLMCCYLFAAWSLKAAGDHGVSAARSEKIERWRRALIDVAIDEMTHMANANNLLAALGGGPHMARQNFPVSPGAHPAGVIVALRRFDRSTIDHFVYLERPEGSDEPDGEAYAHEHRYERVRQPDALMPSAQDYQTVGHLYRSIREALVSLSAQHGEAALFVGDAAAQITPALVQLNGLVAVSDLASALRAVDNIVEQGEGNAENPEGSHYRRFCRVRVEYLEMLQDDPGFDPARAVVANPVQRRPPRPEGRAWISASEAARVLDLSNALYNHMLRFLGAVYQDVTQHERAMLVDEAIGFMQLLAPLNELLTRLPADAANPEAMAGMSFAITRQLRIPTHAAALPLLAERTAELAQGAARLVSIDPTIATVATHLNRLAHRLEGQDLTKAVDGVESLKDDKAFGLKYGEDGLEYSSDPSIPPRRVEDGVEVIEGESMTLRFDTKRCIHARFCVLGAPQVFVGNVVGPWIRPDAMDAEALVAIAHRCPSGAVLYTRKDGRPDEAAPPVNLLYVRENGPYAINAQIEIDGEAPRLRATLCRCGASKLKPFCDGSHHDIKFSASGEPATGDVAALEVRDGALRIKPQPDGPLLVSGNLELCSGTGRTFSKITRAALCRCGASKNKPFCDGSHRAVGFKSS